MQGQGPHTEDLGTELVSPPCWAHHAPNTVRQLWFPQTQLWFPKTQQRPAMMVPWERERERVVDCQQNASHCPFLDTSLPALPSLIPGPVGLPPSQIWGGSAPPSLWLVWPTAWYLFPDWNISHPGVAQSKGSCQGPSLRSYCQGLREPKWPPNAVAIK